MTNTEEKMTKKRDNGWLIASIVLLMAVLALTGCVIGDSVAKGDAFAEERLQTLRYLTELEKDTKVQYTIKNERQDTIYFVTKTEIVKYQLRQINVFVYDWHKVEEFPL